MSRWMDTMWQKENGNVYQHPVYPVEYLCTIIAIVIETTTKNWKVRKRRKKCGRRSWLVDRRIVLGTWGREFRTLECTIDSNGALTSCLNACGQKIALSVGPFWLRRIKRRFRCWSILGRSQNTIKSVRNKHLLSIQVRGEKYPPTQTEKVQHSLKLYCLSPKIDGFP